jgi:hypothetical protein
MALVTCPDCQNSISDAAPACPRCGRPFAFAAPTATAPQIVVTRRQGAPYEMVGALVGIAGTITSCGGCASQSPGSMAGGFVLGMVGLVIFMIGRFMG